MTKFLRTLFALSLFMVAAPLANHAHAQTFNPAPPGTCPPGELIYSGYCYIVGNNPPSFNPTGPEAPEIHLSSSIAGIVLLFGGMMVLRGKKVQPQA